MARRRCAASLFLNKLPAPPPRSHPFHTFAMPDTEIYDVLSVGFGPAAVALAISIVEHDSSPQASPRPRPAQFASLGGLQATAGASLERGDVTLEGDLPAGIERKLRACFVERYDAFSWHPGMMLEGSRMQIRYAFRLIDRPVGWRLINSALTAF